MLLDFLWSEADLSKTNQRYGSGGALLQGAVSAGSMDKTVIGLASCFIKSSNAIPEDPGSSNISTSSEHEALALGFRQWKAVTALSLFQGKVHGRSRPNAVWCQ